MGDPVWRVLIILLITTVAVQTVVLIGVMRQVGGILLQLHPPRVGEMPDQGPAVGTAVDFPGHVTGRPALVLFISPSCSLCKPLVPAIAALRRTYGDEELELYAAVIGGADSDRWDYAKEVGAFARTDLLDLEREWRVPGTPFAVAVDRAGNVFGSGVTNSLDQLESLAEGVIHSDSGVDAGDLELAHASAAGNGVAVPSS